MNRPSPKADRATIAVWAAAVVWLWFSYWMIVILADKFWRLWSGK